VSLPAQFIAVVLLVVGMAGGAWRVIFLAEARGAAQERVKWEAKALALVESNRALQRAAELRYVVGADARDRFIVKTVKEIVHVTSHLADCPVGEPAARMLNAAAACARGDSATACGPGEPVPDAARSAR
jgi:hypothetical protein